MVLDLLLRAMKPRSSAMRKMHAWLSNPEPTASAPSHHFALSRSYGDIGASQSDAQGGERCDQA
jgi:hypothetical protein